MISYRQDSIMEAMTRDPIVNIIHYSNIKILIEDIFDKLSMVNQVINNNPNGFHS